MSIISESTVRKIAELVRIELSAADVAQYCDDLSTILGYVDQLKQIDTSVVRSVADSNGLANIFREDVVTNDNMRDKLLANTPLHENGFIKVRTVHE